MAVAAALLDANVLFSPPLRDLLIELSSAGLYRARWSRKIHEEWGRAVQKIRADISSQVIEEMTRCLDLSVADCLVEGYEGCTGDVSLPDEGDLHVLEAAIKGECSFIVTRNLRDFPKKVLATYGLEAIAPDRFICQVAGQDKAVFLASVDRIRSRFPDLSFDAYLDALKRNRLKGVVKLIKGVETSI